MARDFRADRGALPIAARKPVERALIQPGGATSRNSSSAATLPAAISSTLSQGDPVRRLPPEPRRPEAALQAGGLVERPGPADVGEGVDPPGLGGHLELVEPVEEEAGLLLVQELGPEPGDPGHPLRRVGRMGPGDLAEQVADLPRVLQLVEDHQPILDVGLCHRRAPGPGSRSIGPPPPDDGSTREAGPPSPGRPRRVTIPGPARAGSIGHRNTGTRHAHHDRICRHPHRRPADAAVRGDPEARGLAIPASSSTPTSSSSPAPMLRITRRLAGYGFTVAAPEIYHRIEAPGTVLDFDADRSRALDDSTRVPTDQFDRDIRAALDYLIGHPRVAPDRLAAAGFCFGGHLAFRAAFLPGSEGHRLLLRHRHPQQQARRRSRRIARLEPAEIRGKLLMVFGTHDPHIPEDGRAAIDRALKLARVDHEIQLYPAEHTFMRDEGARHDPEATDQAFGAMIELFRRNLNF